MIVAEVKVNDESDWDVKLFLVSMEAFHRMANRRYVAIGRVAEIRHEELVVAIKQQLGWL